jgi:predicted O-methyltransferase YrrM
VGVWSRARDAVGTRSPKAAAFLDWNTRGALNRWGGPLNGQEGRRSMIRELASVYEPELVVETGTYQGSTTRFLWAVTGVRTVTCEVSPRHAAVARRHLEGLLGIEIVESDSVDFLRRLGSTDAASLRALIYLDAHWEDHLPLAEELQTIWAAWTDALVVIDDFQVPDDEGYAFDDYGPGRRLSMDYLHGVGLDDLVVYLPALPAQEETGARRGCVVLGRGDQATMLNRITSLRSWGGQEQARENASGQDRRGSR